MGTLKFSISQIAEEAEIKTTMNDHFTSIRMAIKKTKNKCWRGMLTGESQERRHKGLRGRLGLFSFVPGPARSAPLGQHCSET